MKISELETKYLNPLSPNPTIPPQSMFDHFVGLALKGLKVIFFLICLKCVRKQIEKSLKYSSSPSLNIVPLCQKLSILNSNISLLFNWLY